MNKKMNKKRAGFPIGSRPFAHIGTTVVQPFGARLRRDG
jgi:hypothetical protein